MNDALRSHAGIGTARARRGDSEAPCPDPFVTGVIRYPTSDTTLNLIIGVDAAALLVVAPACVAIGVLAVRRHRTAAAPALAPAALAVYTYTQLFVGEEYLRRPGNNERYFLLP